jgi:hypothetical protein
MTTTTERIAELTAAWEEGANYGELPEYHVRASDYTLSEDDWRAYLNDDEAAEIVALIEKAENQERAERIADRILSRAEHEPFSPRRALIAAALQALTETENQK